MNQQKPHIVFFGTSKFAVQILNKMKERGQTPLLIITTPDKPQGRGLQLMPSPVKIWAEKEKIPVCQPESLSTCDLPFSTANLFIVASYGKILPKKVLQIPKYGTLNVHPSLLPQYRGASPVQSAILNGDKNFGVTIMLVDEEMDHGPIVKISNLKSQISNPYFEDLENQLAELGGELLVEVIPKWIAGEIKSQDQDHSQATYTKKINKKDAAIDWSEPVELIARQVRAFSPIPGAYFFLNKNNYPYRIIITQAKIENSQLKIEKLKPAGKKEMTVAEFLRGNPEFKNQKPFI